MLYRSNALPVFEILEVACQCLSCRGCRVSPTDTDGIVGSRCVPGGFAGAAGGFAGAPGGFAGAAGFGGSFATSSGAPGTEFTDPGIDEVVSQNSPRLGLNRERLGVTHWCAFSKDNIS